MEEDVFAAVHDSHARWTTLHARVREWHDPQAEVESSGQRPLAPGAPAWIHLGEPHEHVVEVWARSDGALHLDRPDAHTERTFVRAPDGRWVSLLRDGRAAIGGPDRPSYRAAPVDGMFLHPAWLLAPFRLEAVGPVEVAGRPCLRTAGIVLPTPRTIRLGVGTVTAALDRETGLVLRYGTFLPDGRPVLEVEVQELIIGAYVDHERFDVDRYAAAGGAEDDGTGEPGHPALRSLDELAHEVALTVWAPPRARGAGPWVGWVVPVAGTAVVHVVPLGGPARPMLTQSADPARLPDTAAWDNVVVAGQDAYLWRGAGGVDVVHWRDGTGIWLRDAPTVGEAVRLVGSLEPTGP